MRARWRAASILALLAVLLTTVGTANAARLPIAGATLTTLPQVTRCTNKIQVEPGTVRQNGTSTTVVVRGLTPRCAGARVDLTIVDASGAVVRRVSGSVPTSGPATVTLGATAFAPAPNHRVFATVGTWGVPATWTYAPPAPVTSCVVRNAEGTLVPELRCVIDEHKVTAWDSGEHGHLLLNYNVRISGRGSQAENLHVDFVIVGPRDAGPPGWSWGIADILSTNFQGGGAEVVSKCSELPMIDGRGPTNFGTNQNFEIHLVQGGSRGICQPG